MISMMKFGHPFRHDQRFLDTAFGIFSLELPGPLTTFRRTSAASSSRGIRILKQRTTAKSFPGVGEAAANRRATESELRQQGTVLPQERLPKRFNQDRVPARLATANG